MVSSIASAGLMSISADRELSAPSNAGDHRVLPALSPLRLGVLLLCCTLGKLQPKQILISSALTGMQWH